MVSQVSNSMPATVRLNQTPQTPEQKKLMKACTEFEAIMVKKMLEVMQGSTKMFGDGFGGDFFQGMFQDEMAKKISENGQGIGLAKILYQQLNRANIFADPGNKV